MHGKTSLFKKLTHRSIDRYHNGPPSKSSLTAFAGSKESPEHCSLPLWSRWTTIEAPSKLGHNITAYILAYLIDERKTGVVVWKWNAETEYESSLQWSLKLYYIQDFVNVAKVSYSGHSSQRAGLNSIHHAGLVLRCAYTFIYMHYGYNVFSSTVDIILLK